MLRAAELAAFMEDLRANTYIRVSVYICLYIIYIYIYIHTYLSLSLSLYIYIYIYACMIISTFAFMEDLAAGRTLIALLVFRILEFI